MHGWRRMPRVGPTDYDASGGPAAVEGVGVHNEDGLMILGR